MDAGRNADAENYGEREITEDESDTESVKLEKNNETTENQDKENKTLKRFFQNMLHIRERGSEILKEGWMTHFTCKDNTEKRNFWTLDAKSIILFQNETTTKYYKEILLSEILSVEPTKQQVMESGQNYCFEVRTANLDYYIGEDLDISREWEISIRQVLMPKAALQKITLFKDAEEEDEEPSMASSESKVCEDFKNLLLSGEGSDVTLQVQDQQLKAHWSVLIARSSVFAAMFRHDTKEKATGVVNVVDCEPSAFRRLLEFMYCGSTEKLYVANVFSLYTASDKYDLQDLKKKCLLLIKRNLSVYTFCDTLKLSLQHSETNLLKLVEEFFIRNCQQIISSPKWEAFIIENPIEGNAMFKKAVKYISMPPPLIELD